MGRRNKGFNTPFADVKRQLEEKAPAPRPDPPKAPRPPPEPEAPALDDEALFHQWVGQVDPVARPQTGAPRPPPRAARVRDDEEDAEVLGVLSDLVAGERPFEIADTDEYVEGIAQGVDRRLLSRLRKGEYSVQAHLDLHGMVQEEARLAVQRFVAESRGKGLRCVLIVHGRGKNSPDREPVLKQGAVRWLSRGQLGKQVLAFATARRQDGGGGALYVLLRR